VKQSVSSYRCVFSPHPSPLKEKERSDWAVLQDFNVSKGNSGRLALLGMQVGGSLHLGELERCGMGKRNRLFQTTCAGYFNRMATPSLHFVLRLLLRYAHRNELCLNPNVFKLFIIFFELAPLIYEGPVEKNIFVMQRFVD
jgi:hypothetical protein